MKNPCDPNPCGPNSQCKEVNEQAVCSCLIQFVGSPPNCRPECVVSSECPQHQACINNKCADPCPGSCGLNTNCQVINHSPICSCVQGFTGDPFSRCLPLPRKHPEISIFHRNLDHHRIGVITIFFFSTSTCTYTNHKPMRTISLWTKLAM